MSRPVRSLLPLAVVLIGTLLIYAPVLRHGFLNWDDNDLVVNNAGLQHPDGAALRAFWTTPVAGLYTPVAYTFWWGISALLHAMGQPLRPQPLHAANLALHLVCVTLVFALLRQLRGREWPAALGAAVFALHPLQVEAVAWISGMNNVLATSAALGALLAYTISAQRAKSGAPRRGWIGWYAAALLLFILALGAKPTVLALPVGAMAIDRWLVHRRWPAVLLAVVPWLACAAAAAAVTRHVQPASTIWPLLPLQRLEIAADALRFYAIKLAWPFGLTVDYGRNPQWLLHARTRWWGWSVPVAAAPIWWALPRRHRPAALAAAGVWLTGLLPTLGLASFDFQRYSTVADRYVYLSMLAVAMVVTWLADRSRVALVGFTLLLLLWLPLTRVQVNSWQSDQALFERNLQINPRSVAANHVLGFDAVAADQPLQALGYFRAALRQAPADPLVNFAMANLLMSSGDPADALPHYEIALAHRSGDARIHNNYGVCLARLGHPAQAATQFELAAQLSPDWPDPRQNLRRLRPTSQP